MYEVLYFAIAIITSWVTQHSTDFILASKLILFPEIVGCNFF
jgi:hypothetical protein